MNRSFDGENVQPRELLNSEPVVATCSCVTPAKVRMAAEQWDAARKLAHKLRIAADALRPVGGETFAKAQASYERAAFEEDDTFDVHSRLKAILIRETLDALRIVAQDDAARIQLGGILLETPQVAELESEAVEAVQRLDDLEAQVVRLKLARTADRKAVRA